MKTIKHLRNKYLNRTTLRFSHSPCRKADHRNRRQMHLLRTLSKRINRNKTNLKSSWINRSKFRHHRKSKKNRSNNMMMKILKINSNSSKNLAHSMIKKDLTKTINRLQTCHIISLPTNNRCLDPMIICRTIQVATLISFSPKVQMVITT